MMFVRSLAILVGAGLVAVGAASLRGVPAFTGAVTPSKAEQFAFVLQEPGLTSAGVYDRNGRLIRVLWTMRQLSAGRHGGKWDGLDQLDQFARPGEYEFRVVINRSMYKNVGFIGNDASPPNDRGHTPSGMRSLAVDRDGGVYTANTFNEAGADIKKWSSDGGTVYHARNGTHLPYGGAFSIAVDDEYVYAAITGWAPHTTSQQIRRYRRRDGAPAPFKNGRADGYLPVYDSTNYVVSENASESERALFREPLRALGIVGETLLVADALGNRVLRYNRSTGKAEGGFFVRLPHGLAVGPDGRVWVAHQHHKVSVFSATGSLLGEAVAGLGRIESLAYGADGRLYVADSGAGNIQVYNVDVTRAVLVATLGRKAKTGDFAADRFYQVISVAVDPSGNVLTLDKLPGVGSRLAKWSPTGKLLWDRKGLEFMTNGTYAQGNPDIFYSMNHKRYRLLDRNAGTSEYRGHMVAYEMFRGWWPRYQGFGPSGVPRILRLGRNDFFFNPSGDGLQVYRVAGNELKLASLVGGKAPDAEGMLPGLDDANPIPFNAGQWSWTDANGNGKRDPEEFRWYAKPGEGVYAVVGTNVDHRGNLWFANKHPHSIWMLPLAGLDRSGNPIYDWRQQVEVVPRDTSALKFDPQMVQHSDDGSTYAIGYSEKWPPITGHFHMGGTTLMKYDSGGKRLWVQALPEECTGFDVLPGGRGLLIGGGVSATVYHYTSDGLLIGKMLPGEAMGKQSGWFDNPGSVVVNRDPRDGLLDVFTEEVYVGRVAWYRVDDRDIKIIRGRMAPL